MLEEGMLDGVCHQGWCATFVGGQAIPLHRWMTETLVTVAVVAKDRLSKSLLEFGRYQMVS